MKTKYILSACLLSCSMTAISQGLHSGYFVDDLKTRHTMNPAIANDQSYVAIPGLGNLNIKSMGNFGVGDVLFDNPLYGITSDKKKTTFMNPYITGATDGFKDINRIRVQENISILSAGFKAFNGYNTVELNVRSDINAKLPFELFAFAANQENRHYDIGEINVAAKSFAELALGHSRQVGDKLRLGGKLKILLGIAEGNADITHVTADLQDANRWILNAQAEANISMKGFKYVSETKEYKSTGSSYARVKDVDVDGTGIGGFGVGVDLGALYKINEDWEVSAALLDLGFISWSNQMVARNDGKPFEFSGFHDIDVNDKTSPTGMETQGHKYSDQIADFYNLKDKGDQGGRTTSLSPVFTVGGKYTLPSYRLLSLGLLSTTQLGKFMWTEARLSANISPLKWLDGGLSFAVNTYTTSMGWVLNIHPRGYNFFIGMDHLLGKCTKEMIPLSSNASLSLGMSITW